MRIVMVVIFNLINRTISDQNCAEYKVNFRNNEQCLSIKDMEGTKEIWRSPHLGSGPGLVKIKDIWFPSIFLKLEPNKFEKLESFVARTDDIWICSYPKSGTSWIQQIVYLLVYGEHHKATENLTCDERCPYIEGFVPVMDKLNSMPSPRIIKTHLPFNMLPKSVMENKAKVIYIARNVKDVSVSMYHFHQLINNIDYQGTFQDFYQEFIQGKVFYSNWWDHVKVFWEEKENDNLLFLKYEDLHKNAAKEISKIAHFLGITVENEYISRLSELSTFTTMKDNPKVNFKWQEENGMFKKDSTLKFFRKGKVGDWVSYYSDSMTNEVDSICDSKITPLGLHFDYKLSDD